MFDIPYGAPEVVCLYFAVRFMRAGRWSRARCAIIRPTQRHPVLLRAKPSEPSEQQPESKSRPWFAAAA